MMPDFENRWRITGTLETITPLHIGDGGVTRRDKLKVQMKEADGAADTHDVDVSRVATDISERPYIPGRSLKDNLRSWVRTACAGKHTELFNRLFGSELPNKGFGEEEKLYCAGRAEFWDARFVGMNFQFARLAPEANIPYWSAKRNTGVRSRTAIARRTRTVQEDKLFYVEFVPPGTSFEVNISAQGLTEQEVAFLLFALDAFENARNPEFRAQAGAAQDDFWGQFRWKIPPAVRAILSIEEARSWAKLPDSFGYNGFPVLPAETAKSIERMKCTFAGDATCPEMVVVELRLDVGAPVLINEPCFTGKVAEGKFSARACMTPEEKLLVPADSFRGAFRSQAEKILRTLEVKACCASDPDDACQPIESIDEKKHLCAACQTFGAPGWGTPLRISDFVETKTSSSEPFSQDFVAVDRFTSGSADKFKFNAHSRYGPTLEGKLVLETGRLSGESWKLIALTLRDLLEGDVPLGSRSGKGYGALTGAILSITGRNAEAAVQYLNTMLSGFVATPEAAAKDAVRTVDSPAQVAAPPPPDNGRFHNPYHFVPLISTQPADKLAVKAFETNRNPNDAKAPTHLTHDRYTAGENGSPIYSGRIVCRLENETEMVLGARQDAPNPKTVMPFEIGGRPAIPASSLRGLISSTAEAASNSALRILSNSALSRRADFYTDKKLDAIGLIAQSKDKRSWYVIPLALPTIPCDEDGKNAILRNATKFQSAKLRVYLNGYQLDASDRNDPKQKIIPSSFLDTPGLLSKSADHSEFWYLELDSSSVVFDRATKRVDVFAKQPNVTTIVTKKGDRFHFLIGQYAKNPPARPISQAEFDMKTPTEQRKYTKGVLRILGIGGRESDIPEGKIHEVFIPIPDALSTMPYIKATEAVQEFHKLARQRTDAERKHRLPFELQGSKRNADRAENLNAPNPYLELRAGDLVCFRAENDEVKEVAVSSIWRKSVGDCYDFFKKVDPELLPFNGTRQSISIAEQMFGFVEQNLEDPSRPVPNARALASRLRFSFGILKDCPAVAKNGEPSYYSVPDPVVMKILSSPKPPSPSLYFKRAQGHGPVTKSELKPERHRPMGRKFYLHHTGSPCWKTERPNEHVDQKVRVKPLRPHNGFYFHIDFDNLTERELGLLCYSIRPTEAFRHKLGMGKPFGLGTVRIDPLALLFISRLDRYGNSDSGAADGPLDTSRYHFGWFSDIAEISKFPKQYNREKEWIESRSTQGQLLIAGQQQFAKTFGDFRSAFATAENNQARRALEQIGDPRTVCAPVQYPSQIGQRGEGEGFKWFVANDRLPDAEKQQLVPIGPERTQLPTLLKNRGSNERR